MRRFFFLLNLLGVTLLAGSAFGQDTVRARQDTAKARVDSLRDSTGRRVHKRIPATSPGDVDTAKIRAPSRRDSALVRQELRADTASVARDTAARPRTPPDSQAKKKVPPDSQPKKPRGD